MSAAPELARLDCGLVWSRDAASIEAVREVVAREFVLHDQSSPQPITGPHEYRNYVATYKSAFPDLSAGVEAPLVEDDWVMFRRALVGTHRNAFMGVPPSGEEVTITVPTLGRVEDGQFAELWTTGWRSVASALADLVEDDPPPGVANPDPPSWEGTPLEGGSLD